MEGHSVLLYSHIKASPDLLTGILGGMDYDRQSCQFVLNKNDQVESYVLREFHGQSAMFTGVAKENPPTNPAPAH